MIDDVFLKANYDDDNVDDAAYINCVSYCNANVDDAGYINCIFRCDGNEDINHWFIFYNLIIISLCLLACIPLLKKISEMYIRHSNN